LIVPLPGELAYRQANPYAITPSLDAGTGTRILTIMLGWA
jgi:hypothetical protein